jgi:membrane-associated phospholipid phosphatase
MRASLASLILLCWLPVFGGGAAHGAVVLVDSLQPVQASSPNIADTIWTDIVETGTDGLLFFSAPARFSLRSWGAVGWTFVGTGMTMVADDEIRAVALANRNAALDDATVVTNYFGTWVPFAIISGGLYTGGLIFDEPGIRRAGRHVFQSVLYAAAITTTLKALIGRNRPFLNNGRFTFEGPTLKDDFHSFPSGHSTLVFALSSSLAAEIDNTWATIGLHSLATMTALSRIYVDRHWGSDVFLGAAIGMACGYGVVHLHDKIEGPTGLLLFPTLNGVAAVWRF